MSQTAITADYVVVGAGAMGMAFTDEVLTNSDATVALIDRYHAPGGHWNHAYPYVRLHQPSSFYGVNSRKLGSDAIDATGWNAGLYELATSGEVCAYFDQVMQQRFLASDRVSYFPMTEFDANSTTARSSLTGAVHPIEAGKLVDATYMNVTIPALDAPKFAVSNATCEPPNALPRLAPAHKHFVVIGGGKTAMDACLWLLKHNLDPNRITWIIPRDSWILDRAHIQPGDTFRKQATSIFTQQMKCIADAENVDDMFLRLEAAGSLLRLDNQVTPTMYRCATVTQAELNELRRIENVVRLGRVSSINGGAVTLENGAFDAPSDALFVNCTSDGLECRPSRPVFDGNQVTLQAVRTCQQVFSAAMIGFVEATYDDEALKNELCQPVPHPNTHMDYLRTTLQNGANQVRWMQDEQLMRWLSDARLNGFAGVRTDSPELQAVATQAMGKAMQWLSAP